MKKKRPEQRPPAIKRGAVHKPPRKVKETPDGGLVLDDRDAEEPFLRPTILRSAAKRVA
jgi:hypothetical protein